MSLHGACRRFLRLAGAAAVVRCRRLQTGGGRGSLSAGACGLALSAAGLYAAAPVTPDLTAQGGGMRRDVERLCLRLQKDFIDALEQEETGGQKFFVDKWSRKNSEEGGGITCVLEGGEVFSRAAVNVTVMTAPLSAALHANMRSRGKELPSGPLRFFAAGISSVIHPSNPHVPTFHFNLRYFEIQDQRGERVAGWFGGGADLTPYFLHEADAKHFHQTLKDACDPHGEHRYPEYKKTCDAYFYNPSRAECRGVGGLFFDDLESEDPNTEFAFVKDVAAAILPCYMPIVRAHAGDAYSAEDVAWQALRRGRYVEFNLGYDRGTKFGLATPGARIESIMVSMPPNPTWRYMAEPPADSERGKLMEVLRNPRDWL